MKGKHMGLNAHIYKNGGATHGGVVSSVADEVTIVNCDGPFDPLPTTPPVIVKSGPGNRNDGRPRHVIAVPATKDTNGNWVELTDTGKCRMCGGTFVATSDSRFHDLVERLGGARGTAISMHDVFSEC